MISPATHYESPKLKLSEAWEPPVSSGPLPDGEGEETQNGFLNGNQAVFTLHGKNLYSYRL